MNVWDRIGFGFHNVYLSLCCSGIIRHNCKNFIYINQFTVKRPMMQLPSAVALDMDGTFFLGDALLPGALEFLEWLNQKEIRFTFLTNNTSKGRQAYVSMLTHLGVRQE